MIANFMMTDRGSNTNIVKFVFLFIVKSVSIPISYVLSNSISFGKNNIECCLYELHIKKYAISIVFVQELEPNDMLFYQRIIGGFGHRDVYVWILHYSGRRAQRQLQKILNQFHPITQQSVRIGNFIFVHDRDKEKILKQCH